MRTCLTAIIGCTLFFASAVADIDVRDADIDMYPAGTVYDPTIPTPEQFLGRPLGDAPVRHHELVLGLGQAGDEHELVVLGRVLGDEGHLALTDSPAVGDGEPEHAAVEVEHRVEIAHRDGGVAEREPW